MTMAFVGSHFMSSGSRNKRKKKVKVVTFVSFTNLTLGRHMVVVIRISEVIHILWLLLFTKMNPKVW